MFPSAVTRQCLKDAQYSYSLRSINKIIRFAFGKEALLNTLFTSNTMRCLIGDNLCERRPVYVFTEEKIINVCRTLDLLKVTFGITRNILNIGVIASNIILRCHLTEKTLLWELPLDLTNAQKQQDGKWYKFTLKVQYRKI
jgi:hypothetical protein